jgi:hypothetical protein
MECFGVRLRLLINRLNCYKKEALIKKLNYLYKTRKIIKHTIKTKNYGFSDTNKNKFRQCAWSTISKPVIKFIG